MNKKDGRWITLEEDEVKGEKSIGNIKKNSNHSERDTLIFKIEREKRERCVFQGKMGNEEKQEKKCDGRGSVDMEEDSWKREGCWD